MASLTKRSTIYFDPIIHRALKIKAASTNQSISEIVDSAIRQEFAQDEEDIKVFEERAHEPTVSFEDVLKELKLHGKI